MTQSINFDEGYKTYEINGDPERVIRIDTSDYGLMERFRQAEKNLNTIARKYKSLIFAPNGSPEDKTEAAITAMTEFDREIKQEIDRIFNSSVSEVVFGNASSLSTRNGVPLYERFMNAVIPIIKTDLEAEEKKSEKRIRKYSAQAQQIKGQIK